MDLTVHSLYGLLLRSRLLPAEEARAMYDRWRKEAGEAADEAGRFAAWMAARGYVTEYQAALLARGRADGFFLNEYKILERLGKGRMAGVYKAQHRLGQLVAIKVLPPSKAKDPTLLARFDREARLAVRLRHPNVVRAFQTGIADRLHYLVMEYLEGEALDEALQRRGRLRPAEAVRLVHQALQGLQHIHSHGLVHRDLKPANLMLLGSTPDSTLRATVKILDLGLGRALYSEGMEPEPGLTAEGVVLGTPDYMAPEQGRDPRAADIRSDIYSLGCVLYHLLAGQPPFPDTNLISQMIRHATETPRPLREFNTAVPDGLQQIVNWMLAKDPAQRYPTPERAAQALEVFLTAGGEPPASPERDPGMSAYLSWLETEQDRGDRPAVAPAGAPVVAPAAASVNPLGDTSPAPGHVAASVGKAVAAVTKHDHERQGRHRARRPKPATAAQPAPGPAPLAVAGTLPEIDVEPVELPADLRQSRGASLRGRRWDRRDMLLFGLGAVAGALSALLGCLLALRFRHHPAEAEDVGDKK
jgi:serine/threonine protein kinase